MATVDPGENNSGALVGTAVAFLIITYVSVALRTYVRAALTNGFQGDDWLMLVAQVIFTLSCSFILAGVWEGIGRHNKSLPQHQEIKALKWQALATATYVVNMMFIKLSIAVFLLRLAIEKRYKYTLWISMAVVGIWSSVIFIWDIFQCSPVEAQWDYTIPNLRCVTSQEIVSAAYAISVMTIVTDWLYALIPIPMIWNVKMTKQTKATVYVILALGIFASIATLIRLKFLADLNDVADILFAGTDAMVWTLVEPGVAITASSLVTIRPLLRQMRLPGFESSDPSSKGGPSRRSDGMQSGTNRSNRRGAPEFMPGDLTMIDIETGNADPRTGKPYDSTVPSQGTTLASEADPGASSLDPEAEGPRRPAAEAPAGAGDDAPGWPRRLRSEIFVIEGDRLPSHWDDTPSTHTEDHEGMQWHSQDLEGGKYGLGRR